MFGRVMVGLIIIALGGCMIYYSGLLSEKLGRSKWAEEKLGGTIQMWILFGFCGVVIGGLVTFGIISFSDPANMNTGGI